MRLVSARIKNYRIHSGDKPLEIDFDPAMQLIHGPNEAGKSTIMDAIHDALFVKARGQGELHKRMRPHDDSKPEISVVFESSGTQYRLEKKFTGTNGTCQLVSTPTSGGGESWTGDEAEGKLAEVLGYTQSGGRASETPGVWRLCWVRQGQSGLNPANEMGAETRLSLDRILQSQTGQAIGSASDAVLLKSIIDQRDSMITSRGPRANTDWQKALEQKESLVSDLQTTRSIAQELEKDFARLHSCNTRLAEVEEGVPNIEVEITALEEQMDKCREVELRLTTLEARKAEKQSQWDKASARETRLTQLTGDLAQADKEIGLLVSKSEGLSQEVLASQSELPKQRVECARQQAELAEKSAGLDLAKAINEYAAYSKEKETLDTSIKKFSEMENQIATAEKEHSLIKVSAVKLKELNEYQARIAQIAAKIEGASVRVLVKSAKDAHLFINDQEMAADLKGQHGQVVSEPAWVKIGKEEDWVYIEPGGEELARLKAEIQKVKEELNEALHKLGVDSLEKAIGEDARKTALKHSVAELKAELKGGCPEGIDSLREQQVELSAKMAQIANGVTGFTPEKAKKAVGKADFVVMETALKTLQKSLSEASAQVHITESLLKQKQMLLDDVQEQIAQDNLKKAKAQAEWDLIRAEVGDAQKLKEKIATDKKDLESILSDITQVEANRAGLNSADLTEKLDRARRVLAIMMEDKTQNLEKKNTLLGKISANEGIGLAEQIGTLDAALEEVDSEIERHSRKARALDLLVNTLQKCQKESTEALLAPLQQKVAPMLERLFPGASLSFTVDDEGQIALNPLCRGEQRDKFDELSQGATEQVGVIIRLGLIMALADEFGGKLPVILDDALVNSDDQRHAEILSILDYAAKQLQLVILTCDYPAYRGLGLRSEQIKELE